MLTYVLRTHRNAQWPLLADDELALANTLLERAQQDAAWDRQQLAAPVDPAGGAGLGVSPARASSRPEVEVLGEITRVLIEPIVAIDPERLGAAREI